MILNSGFIERLKVFGLIVPFFITLIIPKWDAAEIYRICFLFNFFKSLLLLFALFFLCSTSFRRTNAADVYIPLNGKSRYSLV